MEAFSDGIFAIASTLLVLDLAVPSVKELAVPSVKEGDVGHQLFEQWPIYLAYLVSFLSILPGLPGELPVDRAGVAQPLGHHRVPRPGGLHRAAAQSRAAVLRVRAAVPTHMLAEYLNSENAERVAVTVFGLNLFLIGAFTSLTWHYAVAEHLVREGGTEEDRRALTAKLDPSLASYAVPIGLGLWRPNAAVILYLVIALFVIIPFRTVIWRIRRR
jgi:uncharacterized membrane protein